MLRVLLATTALALSAPALACGGKPCDGCADHAKTAAVDFSAVDAAEGTKLSMSIEGMKCGACSSKITAALKAIPGVNAVVVSHETGEARVAFDNTATSPDALKKVVADTGFKVLPEKQG